MPISKQHRNRSPQKSGLLAFRYMVTAYTLFSLPRFLHCATYGSCSWCLGLAGAPMRCAQNSRLEHPAAPINSFRPSSPAPLWSPPSRVEHTTRPRGVRFPLLFWRGGRWAQGACFARGGCGGGGDGGVPAAWVRHLAAGARPVRSSSCSCGRWRATPYPPAPPAASSPERGKSNSEERNGVTSRQRSGQTGCRLASLKEFPPSEPPPRCPPATANIWNWKIRSWPKRRTEEESRSLTASESLKVTEDVTAIPDSEASHKQAERKKGRRLFLTIPLGLRCEAREVFTRCPSFVQKAKESTEPKPKNRRAVPWHSHFLRVIQPCVSSGDPLVWERGTLEMNHRG